VSLLSHTITIDIEHGKSLLKVGYLLFCQLSVCHGADNNTLSRGRSTAVTVREYTVDDEQSINQSINQSKDESDEGAILLWVGACKFGDHLNQ
jgi:hypothetical protein